MPEADPKFNKTWRRLDRALAMPVFDSCEHTLNQIARELSFTSSVIAGDTRARAFRIDVTETARIKGIARTHIYAVINRLIAGNVWKGSRERSRINPNYLTWRGKYKLEDFQIADCDASDFQPVTSCGTSFPHKSEKTCQSQQTNVVSPSRQTDPVVSPDRQVLSVAADIGENLSVAADKSTIACQPQQTTPIEERPRGIELIQFGEEKTEAFRRFHPTPLNGDAGARGGEGKLDRLRSDVLKLTCDPGLSDAFVDVAESWIANGLTEADIREAILVAHGKGVQPPSFVSFVASASRRIRNDRLAREKAEAAPSLPVIGSLPSSRPSYADRKAAERKATLDKIDAWKEQRAREVRDGNGA
jgi:hypothetical protein